MIFYFSGTGNSKWVAKKLAEILDDKVIHIGEAFQKGEFRYTLAPDEKIGWVFPTHSWGPVPIVLNFISRWHIDGYSENTYCYMVTTCGDDIGMSVEMWRKALGFIQGNAAFSIQMPNNYILLPGFDVDSKEIETNKLVAADKRIEDIARNIKESKDCVDVVIGSWKWAKSRFIYPLYRKFAMSDKSFRCDSDKCNSCGLCAKNCPVGNIAMENNMPKWNGNCAMCLGCIHICPKHSIEYGKQSIKKGRYFHP